VLGIAEPHCSRTYEGAVCVAGITRDGDFRRVYSVPLKYYINNKFNKYQYIRYDLLEEHGDSRPESRKIDPESLETLGFARMSTIKQIIQNNFKSLDYLQSRTRTSLGIIKPEINDFKINYRDYTRKICFTRLKSKKDSFPILPFWPKFSFTCEGRRSCNGHNILCEDIELGNFYRKLYDQMHGRLTKEKIEDKLSRYLSENDVYFLMGTHVQYRSRWLIISLLTLDGSRIYGRRR
jgi:hypothetical protein